MLVNCCERSRNLVPEFMAMNLAEHPWFWCICNYEIRAAEAGELVIANHARPDAPHRVSWARGQDDLDSKSGTLSFGTRICA